MKPTFVISNQLWKIMKLKFDVSYKQLLLLLEQLSEEQKIDLYHKLKAEFSTKSNKLQELILSAPTWTDSDYDAYIQVREHSNTSRLV